MKCNAKYWTDAGTKNRALGEKLAQQSLWFTWQDRTDADFLALTETAWLHVVVA